MTTEDFLRLASVGFSHLYNLRLGAILTFNLVDQVGIDAPTLHPDCQHLSLSHPENLREP